VAPLMRAASLTGYPHLCTSLGADPMKLLARAGLDPEVLADPDRWVSGAAAAELLEISAAATRHEDFGLRLAEHRRLSTLGRLALVVREEPDVRSAVQLLVDYERVYNQALRMRIHEDGGLVRLTVDVELGQPGRIRQATELAMAAFHRTVVQFLGRPLRPASVSFAHPAPADPATHRRLFGPVVDFERGYSGMLLHTGDLNAPNVLADPRLRAYAHEYLEAIEFPEESTDVDRVRELIETLLPTGRCSLDEVARHLHVDRKTVHRRLAEHGESYSSLLGATRRQLAEQLVASPQPALNEVAALLGFSTPSAFSRWFHREFGCSPQQWRTP
jgi:AraC-like DNA-binding protein